MIRLLYKELRQLRWLPPFGLALALAVVALRPVLTGLGWLEGGDDFRAGLLGVVPIFLAVFAAAGSFAREKVAGTLPHLLGLPLSRGRIWSTKVAAALVGFLVVWAMMVLPAVLLEPHLLKVTHLQSFFFDTLFWGLAAFALTLLVSTLSERPVGALLGGMALTFGLILGVVYITSETGALLTGWDSDGLFDMGLWACIGIPAGLLGSWAAFRKGELLARKRKWLFGVTACVLTLLVCFGVTVGLGRRAFVYRRAGVREIRQTVLTGGRAVAFYALGDSSPRERSPVRGWVKPKKPRYRAQDLVLVEADTGRDLLSLRALTPHSWSGGTVDVGLGQGMAVSPDGRYAAILAEPAPLTWGQVSYNATRSLQIRDLRTHRLLYAGLPPAEPSVVTRVKWDGIPDLHRALWSPDGQWLALWARTEKQAQLLTMRADGSQIGTGRIYSSGYDPDQYDEWGVPAGAAVNYTWAPDSQSVYLLGKGAALVRRAVPDGGERVLWTPPRPTPGYEWALGQVSVSPDGKWVAVAMGSEKLAECDMTPSGTTSRWVLAVAATDGSSSRVLAPGAWWPGWSYLTWSPDGRDLYFCGAARPLQMVARWRVGSKAPVPLVGSVRGVRLAALPGDSGVLVWGDGRALVAGPEGPPHPVRAPGVQELARHATLVGVTRSGEAMVQRSKGPLEALDLRTGAVRRIYP